MTRIPTRISGTAVSNPATSRCGVAALALAVVVAFLAVLLTALGSGCI